MARHVFRVYQAIESVLVYARSGEEITNHYFLPNPSRPERVVDNLFFSLSVLTGKSSGATSFVPCIWATGSFCTEPLSATSSPGALPLQHGTSTLDLFALAGTSSAGFLEKKSDGRKCIWCISTGLWGSCQHLSSMSSTCWGLSNLHYWPVLNPRVVRQAKHAPDHRTALLPAAVTV